MRSLIMLLIQSDMLKAFWLLVCPLAYFFHGPVDPSGVFCQVSGFFLAASIEAADIAVLMIAVHTALSLMWPQSSSGETGLYPYRRSAYFCWAVVPLVLSGIVPLTGEKFVDDGPNCYLPSNPSWYRLMLSWVPRYIIFLIILLTYFGIYAYVRFQLARFCRDQRRASTQSISSATAECCYNRFQNRGQNTHQTRPVQHHFLNPRYPKRKRRSNSLPDTPAIAQHGLLDSDGSSPAPAADGPRDRQVSGGSMASTLIIEKPREQPAIPKAARLPTQTGRISWRPVQFDQRPEMALRPTISKTGTTRSCSDATTAVSFPAPVAGDTTTSEESLSPRTSLAPSRQLSTVRNPRPLWRRSLDQTEAGARSVALSLYNIVDILRLGPPRRGGPRTSGSPSTAGGPDDVYLPTDETEEAMRRSRDRMQRQLRLLFVYPAIYVLTWIAPLVAHATGFEREFGSEVRSWEDNVADFRSGADGTNGVMLVGNSTDVGVSPPAPPPTSPFGLEVATVISLCIGAAVDCCFFSAWEKPWRHPRRRYGGSNGGGGIRGFLGDLTACLYLRNSASYPGSPPTEHRRRSLLADCDFLPLPHRRTASGGSSGWVGLGLGRRVRPGRTREEQNRDARLAHLRRDQEAQDSFERARQRESARAQAATGSGGADPGDGGESGLGRGNGGGHSRREWWDAIDIDTEDDDQDPFSQNRGHHGADRGTDDGRTVGGGSNGPPSSP